MVHLRGIVFFFSFLLHILWTRRTPFLPALHQLPASDPPSQNESGSECVNLGEGAGLLCGGDGTVTQAHSLEWSRQQKLPLFVTFP